ncbi:NAD-dependent deacylase [Pseudalkalibacillus caeni]|uniref:NAD-dependent protein deacetylase n=1 Tax=Exobacillus caeni TaxID=2574798 RepID=A0A5R9F3S7_9BACL|nr:NAD-dependent deacylase [Pseudalkalibacillus caeni]
MLAKMLKESNYTVVLTGAGLSTESGLPDFRSSNGLWNNRNPLELATVDAMEHNQEEFISFYRQRMKALLDVVPHAGYRILAEWADKGIIKSFITQNVDGFHTISGHKDVAQLHGTLRECRCHNCGETYPMETFLESNDLTCVCGGFIRPSVVLFGEMLPEDAIHLAEEETNNADLFIVLGSSLQVAPANLFPQIAKQNGAKLVIVNIEQTPLDDIADLVINKRKIGEVLKEVNESI